jgi:hypothetical protein
MATPTSQLISTGILQRKSRSQSIHLALRLEHFALTALRLKLVPLADIVDSRHGLNRNLAPGEKCKLKSSRMWVNESHQDKVNTVYCLNHPSSPGHQIATIKQNRKSPPTWLSLMSILCKSVLCCNPSRRSRPPCKTIFSRGKTKPSRLPCLYCRDYLSAHDQFHHCLTV